MTTSESRPTASGQQGESRSAFRAQRPRPLTAVHRSSDPPTSALRLGATFGNMAGRTSVPDGIGHKRSSTPARNLSGSGQFIGQIADSHRKFGAPGPWAEDVSTAGAALSQQGVQGYRLSASFEMSGWILARGVSVETILLSKEKTSDAAAG